MLLFEVRRKVCIQSICLGLDYIHLLPFLLIIKFASRDFAANCMISLA